MLRSPAEFRAQALTYLEAVARRVVGLLAGFRRDAAPT
jgi:hypothetical protein